MPPSAYIRNNSDWTQHDIDQMIEQAKLFTRVAIARGVSLMISPGRVNSPYQRKAYYIKVVEKRGISQTEHLGEHPAYTLEMAKAASLRTISKDAIKRKHRIVRAGRMRAIAETSQVESGMRLRSPKTMLYYMVLIHPEHKEMFEMFIRKMVNGTFQLVPLPTPDN